MALTGLPAENYRGLQRTQSRGKGLSAIRKTSEDSAAQDGRGG